MSRCYDVRRIEGRLIVLFSVIGLSFLRYLFQNHYGLLYPEVAIAFVMCLVLCALLALVSKKFFVFNFLMLILVLTFSTNAIHLGFFPETSYRWILLGLSVLICGSLYVMREKFYIVLLIFNLSAFAVDVGQLMFEWSATALAETHKSHSPKTRSDLHHVLYVILDEHIGLEGFPKDIAELQQTKETVQNVLLENTFTIYPYAFSNYRSSYDSIFSILTENLLERTGHYPKKNQLFERYMAQKYDIRIYQSDYMVYSVSSSQHSTVTPYTYKAASPASMHHMRLSWQDRLQQLLLVYLQSDKFMWGVYQRLTPPRLHFAYLRPGSLAHVELWEKLLEDIRTAQRNTLFFAHLMIPHAPYVYKEDGTIREWDEWREDYRKRASNQRSIYVEQYRRYAAQVRFLAQKLAIIFGRLRSMGLYDAMTVIVHGDHGSRIRLLQATDYRAWQQLRRSKSHTPAVSLYDYTSEPELQDLLNRFSTLLAIKRPGVSQPQVVKEKGSVLCFLRRFFAEGHIGRDQCPFNSVYLFDATGKPREIPLLTLWNNEVDR